MSKKIISSVLLIVFLFVFASCTPDVTVNENLTENETDAQNVSEDYSVYVLIRNEYSAVGKEYYPEDFDKELVESVEEVNQFYPEDDTSGYRMEYWQQTLRLKLKEPTRENAEKVILSAYKNPQVDVAGYDSLNFKIPDEYESSEYEYSTSSITVIIKKECSEFGREYYPENFDKNLIKSVEVLNQINPGDDTSGYDIGNWKQILSLELKEPGEENVQKAIEAALKNPEVESAGKNYKVCLAE